MDDVWLVSTDTIANPELQAFLTAADEAPPCRFYLVSFVDMLLVSMQYSLNAYVTSDFSSHGLLASTGIVATIVGGTSTFTIAKIIDIWGRVEGFVLMVTITMIGIIMKCVCKNVETYAAAHTFCKYFSCELNSNILHSKIRQIKTDRLLRLGWSLGRLVCHRYHSRRYDYPPKSYDHPDC